ncbi:MAG: hypothetical protein LBB38_02020 [Puniceicoccales bacterium]|nr:hypothetical protein [Puniceicoccales bacterium]
MIDKTVQNSPRDFSSAVSGALDMCVKVNGVWSAVRHFVAGEVHFATVVNRVKKFFYSHRDEIETIVKKGTTEEDMKQRLMWPFKFMADAASAVDGDVLEIQKQVNQLGADAKTEAGRERNDDLANSLATVIRACMDKFPEAGLGEIVKPLLDARVTIYVVGADCYPKAVEVPVVEAFLLCDFSAIFTLVGASVGALLFSEKKNEELRGRFSDLAATKLTTQGGALTADVEKAVRNSAAVKLLLSNDPEEIKRLFIEHPEVACEVLASYPTSRIVEALTGNVPGISSNFLFERKIGANGTVAGEVDAAGPFLSFVEYVAGKYGANSDKFSAARRFCSELSVDESVPDQLELLDSAVRNSNRGLPLSHTILHVAQGKIDGAIEHATTVIITSRTGFQIMGQDGKPLIESGGGKIVGKTLDVQQLNQLKKLNNLQVSLNRSVDYDPVGDLICFLECRPTDAKPLALTISGVSDDDRERLLPDLAKLKEVVDMDKLTLLDVNGKRIDLDPLDV